SVDFSALAGSDDTLTFAYGSIFNGYSYLRWISVRYLRQKHDRAFLSIMYQHNIPGILCRQRTGRNQAQVDV
ncbi:hypothetical protein N9383_03775, partial [Granulosicoccus sp.]|nr:hypothetical protein [Granulosicoccus sp.]